MLILFFFHAAEKDFPFNLNQEGTTGGAAGSAAMSDAASSFNAPPTISPGEKDPVKAKQMQHESRLLHYLLKNYNKQVRPVLDHTENVTVHVGITLTQIFDMVRNILRIYLFY